MFNEFKLIIIYDFISQRFAHLSDNSNKLDMLFESSKVQFGGNLNTLGPKTLQRRKSKFFISNHFQFQLLFVRAVLGKDETVKSFHATLAPVILLGNIFSIFPVAGIFSKNVENLKFRIFYPVAIYSIIVQFCFMVELVLLFMFLSKSGLKLFMIGE